MPKRKSPHVKRTEQLREIRLRLLAERHGLRLEKSRRRDPRAIDDGGYWLLDDANFIMFSAHKPGRSATLVELEAFLTCEKK